MPATKLNRAIKYRAYPTEEQAALLARTFGCVRFIWNQMLSDSIRFYEETGQMFIPTPAKYKSRFPFLKEVDSMALCNAQLDLQGAYRKALSEKNAGFPKYKRKKFCKDSYTTNVHIRVGKNFVRLPKLGNIRIAKHRGPKNGWRLKSATVKRTNSGKYFISVLYEFEEVITPVTPTLEGSLGLDYSSHDFYVDSNGVKANYSRYYRLMEKKLARAQRRLSRMQRGSNNYKKQLQRVRAIQEKVANRRKEFCHTLSTAIAKRYDAVFVEDINLRGMASSLKLGKSTNDNGFGMFRNMLAYKLAERGKIFAKVDKWFPSSKACHCCGFVKKDLTLNDREWVCPECGVWHDRDHNAAINILIQGFANLGLALAAT